MATMMMQPVKKKLGVLILILLVAAAGTADGVCVHLVDIQSFSASRDDLVVAVIVAYAPRDDVDDMSAMIWRRHLWRRPGDADFLLGEAPYEFVAGNSDVNMCELDPCHLTLRLAHGSSSDSWSPLSVRIRGYDTDKGLFLERTFKINVFDYGVDSGPGLVIDQCSKPPLG